MPEQDHTTPTKEQPSGRPNMTANKEESNSSAFMKGASKEAGEQTVKYGAEHGEETFDKAKTEAQGLWAKYCGCLGGA